jgi:shikimate O-hydroxycinnamoyltransferase
VFTGIGSYPIEFVFSYNGEIDPERLRSSLNETFKYFPPACSRLIRLSDKQNAFEYDPDGYRFSVVLTEIEYHRTEKRAIFIDPVETEVGEPLISIRLTQTPTGSVLGVSMSHAVADGFSYFYLLSSWARLFHGRQILPPSHERALLDKNEVVKKNISESDVLDSTGLFLANRRKAFSRDELVWDVVKLDKEMLTSMLEESQRKVDARLSVNDVVTAMLAKKYISKWNKSGQADAYISCPVDFRRLIAEFPTNYFGNAVSLATAKLKFEYLMEMPVSELALMIRSKIASVNKAYIDGGMEMLTYLTAEKGVGINEHIHVAHPQSGLLVTNLSRLPIPEVEFNAGPPDAYEILTPAQRGAVVLPDKDGIQIRICNPID